MELHDLRYFIQIAKDKNYTKAAAHLFVSQPALSRAMKKLENEFNVPLLNVRSNGVTLTDYGNALYIHGERLLKEFDELKNIIQDVHNMLGGHLTIGVTPMLNALIFENVVLDFKAKYPSVQITVVEGSNKQLREQLQDNKLDIALCITDEVPSLLQEIPLFQDPMVVCMPEHHPLSSRKSISFKDLKGEQFNFYSTVSTLHDTMLAYCK